MPWRNRIGRARAGAPDVTRSTSRPAISIGIPRDSSRPAGRGQAARIASRSRPGAARWLGPEEEEAEEADGLERHRDPDGRLAPDPVRDRAHDETARDGADADGRDDPGAGQRRVPEVARERDEVNERDEDRDPRRRERGA